LIQDNKGKSFNGVQYLDRIPLLGICFVARPILGRERRLIILMCPEVSLRNSTFMRLRMKNENRTHFGPEIDQSALS